MFSVPLPYGAVVWSKIVVFPANTHLLLCIYFYYILHFIYGKTCLKRPLKNRQNKDLNDKWKLNEGRKYCRMLPLEHSAIHLTCLKR